MDKIFLRFIDICRLKAAPQDLPSSRLLMGVTLFAYGTIALFLTVEKMGLGIAIQIGVVDALLLAGLAYIMLWVRDFTERYVQMVTAMAGSCALLELLLWPLLMLQQYGVNDGGMFFVVIATILLWAWLIWEVAIIANIIKHGLDASIWMALIISFFYIFMSYGAMRTLFFSQEVATAVPVT
ncbi:MAG: hypothetical protein L3J89_02805 [Gammaproteobacteria bacterium]|nr:hypothetical protein [Gammaproteobacteria bacterium]